MRVIDNFAQFSSAIKGFSDKLDQQATDFEALVGIGILRNCIHNSPVLTGRYKGNWQVSLNTPIRGATENTDPIGNATVFNGTTAIDNIQPGDSIWIVNNVPYAEVIEFGGPNRRPRRVLQRALVHVERAAKTLG